jgi:O-methyltransferase
MLRLRRNRPELPSRVNDVVEAEALADQCAAALGDAATRAAFFDRMLVRMLAESHGRTFWGDRLLSLDKSMGFLDDSRFADAYQQIKGSHQYDQYNSPHTVAWRLHTLVWAAENSLALDGDFVECGVFKGDFAWVVAKMTDFDRQPRTFYLYDTFAGFASAYSCGDDFPDNPNFLAFAHSVYSDPAIYEEVQLKFASYPNVRIVRGILPDTLAEVVPAKIAFMHIDLNSPAAEIGILRVLFDRVVPNGVIVFDDYGWHQFRKQKQVEDAFMAERGYRILELPTGQGMVIKR